MDRALALSAGPYREAPSGIRFVCLACYRYASAHGGVCPRCDVDLLPIDRAEVRADLRAEAERRLDKRLYAEYFALSLLGFVLSVPVLLYAGDLFYLGVALGAGQVGMRAYTRMRPGSAMALYAERRRRLALELAGHAPALPAAGGAEADGDPEGLDLAETLRWLGLRLDEPKRLGDKARD